MQLKDLINQAVENSGTPQTALAEQMNLAPARLSEMKSGKRRPNPHELAFLADKAHLPMMETLAVIEKELNPTYSKIWEKAIQQLRKKQGLSRIIRRFKRKKDKPIYQKRS